MDRVFWQRLRCAALPGLLGMLLGCSAPAPRVLAASSAEPELHHGALADYVPAAGLRWLITGSPQALAHAPALSELRQRWLTDGRAAAFARATGIDLARTQRGLIAGFDLGTLYLADASGWVAPPELAFTDRLAGSELKRRTHPRITSLSGVVGTRPQALVRVDDALVAYAIADLTLARVVESFALGRFANVATAFEGAALSGLPAALREPRPLALYLLGPFDPERIAGTWPLGDAAGLLAGASALVVTVEPEGPLLALQVALSGSWRGDVDAERLLATWRATAAAPLGRALGLDRPRDPARVGGSESLVWLRTRLDGAAFSRGLESSLTGAGDLLGGSAAGRAAKRTALRLGRAADDRPPAAHRVMHAASGAVHHRADDRFAFDIGGWAVWCGDLGGTGGGEPRCGSRLPEGRLDP